MSAMTMIEGWASASPTQPAPAMSHRTARRGSVIPRAPAVTAVRKTPGSIAVARKTGYRMPQKSPSSGKAGAAEARTAVAIRPARRPAVSALVSVMTPEVQVRPATAHMTALEARGMLVTPDRRIVSATRVCQPRG